MTRKAIKKVVHFFQNKNNFSFLMNFYPLLIIDAFNLLPTIMRT